MSQRLRRVNEAVKEIVAEMLPGLKDPRIGFVTVTDVRTTTDFRAAEIFYTVLPDTDESRVQTQQGLTSAAPMLRRELNAQLRLRRIPEIHFVHDPLPEHSRRIDTLLRDAQPLQEGDTDDADR
jgi:ribosome-binding factor A